MVQIVRRADAAEYLVDDADLGKVRRHKTPCLGENAYQRVLPQKGTLAGHVRARDKQHAFCTADGAVIGSKMPTLSGEAGLDGGMTATDDVVGCGVVQQRPDEMLLLCEGGEAACDIDGVENASVVPEMDEVVDHHVSQRPEDAVFLGSNA